jgi:hypothetical protein
LATTFYATTTKGIFTFYHNAKEKIPYLSNHSICCIGMVQMDGGQGSNNPTKNSTIVEPVASLAAWLLCFEPHHPREPLRKGLTKGSVAGFDIIMPTSQENYLLVNKIILF